MRRYSSKYNEKNQYFIDDTSRQHHYIFATGKRVASTTYIGEIIASKRCTREMQYKFAASYEIVSYPRATILMFHNLLIISIDDTRHQKIMICNYF
jgi:hypothetical protein